MDREWVYRCPDVLTAAQAVQRLDTWPREKIVGLGVAVRGWLEEPEEFYLFVNAEGITEQEAGQIKAIMSEFGEVTPWSSFGALYDANPRPHLVAAGLSSTILPALAAAYPNIGIPEVH